MLRAPLRTRPAPADVERDRLRSGAHRRADPTDREEGAGEAPRGGCAAADRHRRGHLNPRDRRLLPPEVMSSENATLRHSAFVYEADDEYVARSVAFLKDGLEAGEGCIFAQTRDRIAMMRDALGPDADRVAFVDVSSDLHAACARRGGLLRNVSRRAPQGSFGTCPRRLPVRPVRPGTGTSGRATRRSRTSPTPICRSWVVCTYDANGLPDPVLEEVGRTHPEVLSDGLGRAATTSRIRRRLVRRLTPRAGAAPGASLSSGRRRSRALPRGAGARADGREGAGGQGPRHARRGHRDRGERGAARRRDRGGSRRERRTDVSSARSSTAEAASTTPRPATSCRGRESAAGLWVARQLTWRLESFHSPRGFTVRIWL